MHWKPLADRVRKAVCHPDRALLIELATGALLLAWVTHWMIE